MKIKKTTEQFIEDARKVHGNKYDYSKVEYKSNKIKVCIICPKHGEFWQTPSNHLTGYGCKKCGTEKASSKQRNTIINFTKKAKQVHGDKYDYSKVNYVNNHTKICIICPEHGEFEQTPSGHLCGNGCPKCAELKKFGPKKTQFEVINKCKKLYPEYDFSKTVYKGEAYPFSFICPVHGKVTISQAQSMLLKHSGCPKCAKSRGEKEIELFLNKNNIKFIDQFPFNIDTKINKSGIGYVDFYLPEQNIFIEYNGKQHYVPVKQFGGEIEFKRQIERDNFLLEYCKSNNIKLIVISYKEKNIENYLTLNLK